MRIFAFALAVLTMAACARQLAPTGGPKDTTPPELVPEKSTPNQSTRFAGREINLSFNEWVTLQDAATQVLVSPPLAKKPEITLKGKTVTLRFNKQDTLRANTTYTINFGTAIKDLHEGNPAKDLRFVFSTGDFIDSLSVAGVVNDAFTGEPLENMAVMLYDKMEDSIVRKERPYYLARTDKNGQYAIPNVRAGTFKCVAIDDANQNLKWDGETERIGFPQQAVPVSDSTRNVPAIRVFKPQPALRLLTKNTGRYGLIKLGFSRSPDSIPLSSDQAGLKWRKEIDKDTLIVWYDLSDSVAWKLLAGKDTVAVKALSRSSFVATNRLFFADEAPLIAATGRQRGRPATAPAPGPAPVSPPKTVLINPRKPVVLPFNNPLVSVDTSRWLLLRDSLPLRNFKAIPDTVHPRQLRLLVDWTEGHTYRLTLLPGALRDLYGGTNTDTLRRLFSLPSEKQFGSLNLNIKNLVSGQRYVLRLLDGNNLEEERFFRADSSSTRQVFARMQPATFTAVLIEDRNNNHEWDPGDYFGHRQAEPVFQRKLEALRANWEVEAVLEANPTPAQRRKKE